MNYLRAALTLVPGRRGDELPRKALLTEVSADRERLTRYSRVCGFPLSDRLPPTYPHVLAFDQAMGLMTESGFPFPVVGLVHVANRMTVRRAIGAGERLSIKTRADNLRPHDRGQQFDVIATASVDGAEVWRGVSTYLSKSGKSEPREKRDHPPTPAPTAQWRVPQRTGSDYAAVSGDHNPIHTSLIGARLFGSPRPIAHGMWTKARCLAALHERLPESYTVDVAFKQPILLPARVGFRAERSPDGWEFRVDGARPHLAGVVTPP
jgi:hypothetical protein